MRATHIFIMTTAAANLEMEHISYAATNVSTKTFALINNLHSRDEMQEYKLVATS